MTDVPRMTCYRHPDRETGIVCARCQRPICPACMVDAAVGFQCPECTREGARQTRQGQLPYGGHPSREPRGTTIVLVVLNVLVWLAINSRRLPSELFYIAPRGECLAANDPNLTYGNVTQVACSALGGHWIDGVATGAWWQVVTSMFSQAEPLHLAMNMFSLFVLGPPVERVLGRTRFLAVYLISGLAASASVMWFEQPYMWTLGASGAIFGLLGALLLLTYRAHGNYQMVLILLAVNVGYTFLASGISWQGHLGGLAGGLATTAIIVYAPRSSRSRTQLLGLSAVAVLVLAATVWRALMLA